MGLQLSSRLADAGWGLNFLRNSNFDLKFTGFN